jgi:hypothetical protein
VIEIKEIRTIVVWIRKNAGRDCRVDPERGNAEIPGLLNGISGLLNGISSVSFNKHIYV